MITFTCYGNEEGGQIGKTSPLLHQLPASQEREDKRLFNPYITGIGRSFRSSAVTFCTMITFTLYRNEEGGQIGKVLSVLHQLQTSEEGEERRLFNPS
jgi:hypothetical protein